ncbi:MAG: hypothetical protein QF732_08930, partial [Nitrospinaceae bacterium]|nr:hypothetical protein [Nitrospinaceae bacterium]
SFVLKKVLTVTDLTEILQCSLITVRRRLKEWDACTSYNTDKSRGLFRGSKGRFQRNLAGFLGQNQACKA